MLQSHLSGSLAHVLASTSITAYRANPSNLNFRLQVKTNAENHLQTNRPRFYLFPSCVFSGRLYPLIQVFFILSPQTFFLSSISVQG